MEPTTLLFLLPVLLIGAFGIYQVKTVGFKGATFGAKILDSSHKIKLGNGSGFNGHIKIHSLEHQGNRTIGIEVVQKTPSATT